MPRYEVYATRWDDPHIVDELIPATGLQFSLPLSDHGEASFTATVESGKSFWRPSIALPMSGILIARDSVPVWSGWVTDERPAGPRSFSFTAREWGFFFESCEQPARQWTNENDHQIFRDLITAAQAVAGQNVMVQVDPSTTGATASTRTINAWDTTTVAREFRSVSEAQGGPEWCFPTAGTMENPARQLLIADRLGHTEAQTVLEGVEDTLDYRLPDVPPTVALLGGLFPGKAPLVPTRRAGGNLIAWGRTRSVANAATRAVVIGDGVEAVQKRADADAGDLIDRGWPRMTYVDTSRTDVKVQATLQRHADAALADRAGIPTDYSLVTLDGDQTADWTQTPRGSTVGVLLDTDVFGTDRPVGGADGFAARSVNTIVRVPDAGDAQVEWVVTTVMEVQ